MIKEFEPPFFYAHHSIIEEKIKSSSNNLFQNKIKCIILLLLHNIYFIHAYIMNKKIIKIFIEIQFILPLFLLIFFYTPT